MATPTDLTTEEASLLKELQSLSPKDVEKLVLLAKKHKVIPAPNDQAMTDSAQTTDKPSVHKGVITYIKNWYNNELDDTDRTIVKGCGGATCVAITIGCACCCCGL